MHLSTHSRLLVPDGPQALLALARQHRSPLDLLEDAARRDQMRQIPLSERRSKTVEWRAGELVEVETTVTGWAAPSRAPERSRAAPAPKAVARPEPAPATSASTPETSEAEAPAASDPLDAVCRKALIEDRYEFRTPDGRRHGLDFKRLTDKDDGHGLTALRRGFYILRDVQDACRRQHGTGHLVLKGENTPQAHSMFPPLKIPQD